MKFIKALTSLLLVTILIFPLAGCGNTNNPTSTASSETLITTTPSPNSDFSSYVGIWSESGLSWDFGGLTLELSFKNEDLFVDCRLTQGAPQSHVAKFTQSVKVSEIKNNSFIIDYQDDGFGNSGTAEITLTKGYILVDFTKVDIENSIAQWGFYESTYKLEKNDNAYKLLKYDAEDYKEKYPDDNSEDDAVHYEPPQQQVTQQTMYTFPIDNTQSSIYDTSKASGILASMGMTEKEFKDSCTPLHGYFVHSGTERIVDYYLTYGKQYFQENPNNEELQKKITYWDNLKPSQKDHYSSIEQYLSENLYIYKGQEILFDNTAALFKKMKEYPSDYIGKGFVFLDLNDLYHSSYHVKTAVSVEDVRDDISNPNLLFSEYNYFLYTVFTGTSTGVDGLVLNFDLIAIEKVDEH